MSYVYIKSERAGHQGAEHDLFTVGFYHPDGQWEPESDYAVESEAADRVIVLNGGTIARSERTNVDEEVINFLLGSAPLDGHWFGEKPLEKPMYWWRDRLKAMLGQPKLVYDKDSRTIVQQERGDKEWECICPVGMVDPECPKCMPKPSRCTNTRNITDVVSEYVKDYEFRGDDGDHTPNDAERVLIEDAIQGLLVDEDFLKAWNARAFSATSNHQEKK